MRYFRHVSGQAFRALYTGARNTGHHVIRFFFMLALLFPSGASAAPSAPSVVVSIKPLHALVAAVMQGVAMPGLIVQGAGSVHGYQLRPDDAEKLAGADIVFWAGPGMESFLVRPLANLSSGGANIALAHAPGIHLLDIRAAGSFERHHHVQDHDADNHADAEHAQAGRHRDLHFWLDPHNAAAAVRVIADVLSGKDPANAALYHRNAAACERRIDHLTADIRRELAPVRGRHFIVFHDAYQYFENRFDIPAAGSVTFSRELAPGVRRIAEIRGKVKALGPACVFSEPQFEPRLVNTIIEGTGAGTGVLDPLGADIEPGSELYFILLRRLAHSLKHCLSG